MSSKPSAPKPIDPNEAAAAQARWTRTGQITPFGSVEWQGNNQVIKPSEQMMALFGQAAGLASGGGDRYKNPDGFSSIRDSVIGRLNANNYGSSDDEDSLAKGTPFRDAFLGEKDPETGERRTMRHLARGGLYGSLGRGLMNWAGERMDARRGNKPVQLDMSLGDIGRRVIEQSGKPPVQRPPIGNMPGPVPVDRPGMSPIEQTPPDQSRLTPEQLQQFMNDPRSILNPRNQQQNPMDPIDRGPLSNFVDRSAVTRAGGQDAQQQALARALAAIQAGSFSQNIIP
jgi:hypothetical protein